MRTAQYALLSIGFVFFVFGMSKAGEGEDVLQEYRVTDSKGPTGVVPGGTKNTSPAVVGMTLMPGDHLVTGSRGWIELADQNGTVLQLKEKSSLKVEKLSPRHHVFALKVGRLLARFAPRRIEQKNFYQLRTLSCVAAVRGTELALDVSEDGKVEAGVVEGEVEVSELDASLSVPDEISVSTEMGNGESSQPVASLSVPDEVSVTTETEKPEAMIVGADSGVVVESGGGLRKLEKIPPLMVGDLVWFENLRERIPQLRVQWNKSDVAGAMRLRQGALSQRVKWSVPEKYLADLVPPSRRIQPMFKPSPFRR